MINFKQVQDSESLQQLLETYLPLGQVTSADVIQFLSEQGFDCGELEFVTEAYALSSMQGGFAGAPFDSLVACRLTTKRAWRPQGCLPWNWLLSWLQHRSDEWTYVTHFHFAYDTLVDILIVAAGTGF